MCETTRGGRARTAALPLLGLSLASGCGSTPEDRPAYDTSAPPPVSAAPTPRASAPGPLTTRHEAQQWFDSARASLGRGDYAATAGNLTHAAEFMRSHAAQAELGALAALQGSAKELEFTAERLAKGDPYTLRSLDRVLANANRAEAQHHLTRALAALANRASPDAGEEILMAVDHLERAARDLRQSYDPQATPLLSDARAVAGRLVRETDVPRTEARRVTAKLASELSRICTIIDVEARACAVEAARR